jgi:hypothetical protein
MNQPMMCEEREINKKNVIMVTSEFKWWMNGPMKIHEVFYGAKIEKMLKNITIRANKMQTGLERFFSEYRT